MDTTHIRFADAIDGRTWDIPRRTAKSVDARVNARRLVNVARPQDRFDVLTPTRFLAPQFVRDNLLLRLGAWTGFVLGLLIHPLSPKSPFIGAKAY